MQVQHTLGVTVSLKEFKQKEIKYFNLLL